MRQSKCLLALLVFLGSAAIAPPAGAGNRLQWTGAVTQVEGSSGGGIVPWALIGGLGTDDEIGATAFLTKVSLQDFSLQTGGVSAGIKNRFELSWARQRFNANSVIPGLILGQDIVGLKIRLVGDAVFESDSIFPQIAAGAQWKRTLDFGQIPRAVGASRGQDVDLYLAATKLYFAAVAGHNVILDGTIRRTRANQLGLLGFDGKQGGFSWVPEMSAAVWLSDSLLLGAEFRAKPSNLAAFREGSAKDLFLAWGPGKNFTLTVAWADLGPIAGKTAQHGTYLSLWAGF